MRKLLSVALMAMACGGSSEANVSVHLRYMTVQFADAGAPVGSTDAGTIFFPDGGVAGHCTVCDLTQSMSLNQFEYGVRPKTSCAVQFANPTSAMLDCTGTCGNSAGYVPPGAESTACVWAPPPAP